MAARYALPFSHIHTEDAQYVGEKAAHIGEMISAGLPIPNGFIVTPLAFTTFLEKNNITEPTPTLILQAKFPEQVSTALFSAYKKLGGVLSDATVHIFSSSIHAPEKKITAKGEATVLEMIKQIWAQTLGKNSSVLVQIAVDTKHVNTQRTHTIQIQDKNEGHAKKIKEIQKKIEKHFYFPQEFTYVQEKNALLIIHMVPTQSEEKQTNSLFIHRLTATKLFALTSQANAVHVAKSHVDGAIEMDAKNIATTAKMLSPRPLVIALSKDLEEELKIIKTARNTQGNKNISVLLPPVNSLTQFLEIKTTIASMHIHRSPTCKFWMRLHTPAQIINSTQYIEMGIDGIMIDFDQLEFFMTGRKNTHSLPAPLDDSLLWACQKIISAGTVAHIPCFIWGEAITKSPTFIKQLVTMGIAGICVNPELIESTRFIIADTERKMLT